MISVLSAVAEIERENIRVQTMEGRMQKARKANGIAKYLENHGIHKIARQNGKNPLFDAALIREDYTESGL